jgi:Fic family protein
MYEPRFNISNELLNNIAAIEALRATVAGSPILPERRVELRYRATVEKVHDSTSIEGNPLTLKQVETALSDRALTRRDYAVREVKNYKKALDHIEHRKLSDSFFSIRDLFAIHRLAMGGLLSKGKTGVFRSGDIYIVNQDDEVKYQGPPAENVKALTDDLLEWLGSAGADTHPCVAAAVLHYQLVTIHPFSDGNGRAARLAVMLYLGMRDYDFDSSIILDSYYTQDKPEYYAALHKCQGVSYDENADITPWIEYFTEGFLSSAKVLSAEIAIVALLSPSNNKQRLSAADTDILSYARQFGSVTVTDACGILKGASRRTVQRKLKDLVDEGLLEVSGKGKNTRYLWRE